MSKGDVALNFILEHVFRSNPAYELALFERLPLDQQELLKNLTKDPDFYGVLLPRTSSARGIKSVCRDTALLVHTMLQSGPLPRYVEHTLGDHSNQAVAELVLDGVLEIEHEGRFLSGAEAYPLIYASHTSPEPQGLLPRLSQAALEYAQALAIDDVVRLSARLYFYNRIPMTANWTRRMSSEIAVSEFLGISSSTNRNCLQKNWILVERSASYNGWFQWQSRRNRPTGRDRYGYKLYVSPRPEALPTAFRAVVGVLDNSAAHAFKIGCDSIGLLRPDKLVLYFSDFDLLEQAAREIALSLSGCAAHGVPFTAAIDDNGLLSWGIDPLPEKDALSWQGPESWRLWITNRLATALVSARNNCPGTLQPWQFALERLRLENVDTGTWAPTQGFALSPT
jgi:hypothetical protein